jgi:polyribonucleotide nucleotidyltransferase
VRSGDTVVLATAQGRTEAREGADFFPLTVDVEERMYAAGKIPGGFFKREGRPTEKETLVSRLIDRPIRPLFASGWRCDTQIIVTVLSHDLENDPDILAMVATSAALTLSGAPFMGPIGGARVGYIDGEYVLNPTLDQLAESDLDLVVAGTADAVLMVESEAKELSEEAMLGAVMHGHAGFQPVIDAIIRLAERARQAEEHLAHNCRGFGEARPKAEAVDRQPEGVSPELDLFVEAAGPPDHREEVGRYLQSMFTAGSMRSTSWSALASSSVMPRPTMAVEVAPGVPR